MMNLKRVVLDPLIIAQIAIAAKNKPTKGMEMKLLELTDFFTKEKKEYIVIDKLVRIEPYTKQYVHIKYEDRAIAPQRGLFSRLHKSETKTEKVEISREIVDRNGSHVVLSDSQTMVMETPEEIAKLLADGTKTTEIKGA